MKTLFGLVALLFLDSQAFAESVRLVRWYAVGNGCPADSVQVLDSENTFSILFSQMGPNLRARERSDGMAMTRTCLITFKLEVPRSQCLKSVDHLLSGGVIKSANSKGSLLFLSFLNGHPVLDRTLTWHRGDEILPEDSDSIFSMNKSNTTRHCISTRYQWYSALLNFSARRYSTADHFQGSLDAIDGNFNLLIRIR